VNSTAPEPLPRPFHGSYVLHARLGKGATAYVYDAVDERTQRRCVIKVSRPIRRKYALLVLNEAAVLAQVAGDGVPQVYDAEELADGRAYYAREWLEAVSLEDLGRAARPSLVDSLALVRRVLQILATTHQRGVLHRDIKPANILVPTDGTNPRYHDACLIDFGSAGDLGDDASRRRTRGRRWSGTPKYMAPEQLQGRSQTVATDLFATGVVLYELLFGCAPMYDEETEVSVVIETGERPFTFAFVPERVTDAIVVPHRADIPPGVHALLERLLAHDARLRPDSARHALELAAQAL
jgi:eukaryotic-like serine/threonine-protein kinase